MSPTDVQVSCAKAPKHQLQHPGAHIQAQMRFQVAQVLFQVPQVLFQVSQVPKGWLGTMPML